MAVFAGPTLVGYARLCEDAPMNDKPKMTRAAYLGPPRPIPQTSAEDIAYLAEKAFPRGARLPNKPVVSMRMEYQAQAFVPTRKVDVNGLEVCKVYGGAPIQEMNALLETLAEHGAIEYKGMM